MTDRPSGPGQQSLGRYHLAEPLGGGPTGEVFRAKVYGVAGFERQFAVKRFHRALTDQPELGRMIADAARAYQTIEHPRIARMHEYGAVEGVAFAAVELVNGVDLTRLLAGTHGVGEPLSQGGALGLMAQLARALGYAHGRGVTHGGICPTNVLVTTDGDMKVTDFGFLRARLTVRPVDDPTLAARLPYLAPEQIMGAAISPATDVFQLATLCHEILTGERGYVGDNRAEIGEKIAAGGLPDAPANVAPPIAEVLRRAAAVAPGERYADASAFADALDASIRRSTVLGGRSDVASAVRRIVAQSTALQGQQMSGAVSFPMPAPPRLTIASFSPPAPPPPPSRPALPAIPRHDDPDEAATTIHDRGQSSAGHGQEPPPEPVDLGLLEVSLLEEIDPSAAAPLPPPPAPPPTPRRQMPLAADRTPTPVVIPQPPVRTRTRSRALLVTLVVVGLAAGGFFAFQQFIAKKDSPAATAAATRKPDPVPVATTADAGAGAVVRAPVDAGVPVAVAAPADAAPIAMVEPPPDAAVVRAPEPPDAGPEPDPVKPGTPGKLSFTSEPSGAAVYLDGSLKGKTPLELPATGDRHKVTIMLAGHKLHRGEIDGQGLIEAKLARVEPSRGEAGIKVKCKTKNRFYVIVDGNETGEICPTERIHVPLGLHTVEVFDPVTDNTTTHKLNVKDTHSSARVKIDE